MNNAAATAELIAKLMASAGYEPTHGFREAITAELEEIDTRDSQYGDNESTREYFYEALGYATSRIIP